MHVYYIVSLTERCVTGGCRGEWGSGRGQADAGGPRQAGGGDLPTRGQGQERVHLARGVLRT